MQFAYIESKSIPLTYSVTISDDGSHLSKTKFGTERTLVRYRLLNSPGREFEIQADCDGVVILGGTPYMKTQDDLTELYRVMLWAYRQHMNLKSEGLPLDQEELSKELDG